MPTLGLTNFNTICSVLGGSVALVGLFSDLLKDGFYIPEACTSPFSAKVSVHECFVKSAFLLLLAWSNGNRIKEQHWPHRLTIVTKNNCSNCLNHRHRLLALRRGFNRAG